MCTQTAPPYSPVNPAFSSQANPLCIWAFKNTFNFFLMVKISNVAIYSQLCWYALEQCVELVVLSKICWANAP